MTAARRGIQFLSSSFPRRRESSILKDMSRSPAVYILSSGKKGTLYIGVTSDLPQRVWQHREDLVEGFTKKYGVHRLVYFEQHEDMEEAILREKQIKKWNRAWKVRLIEAANPNWRDLYPEIAGAGFPPSRE
jgi:putative endonuclease